MASKSKKRKCKNTLYDRGGEKGKIHYLKGYAMYHKKERVVANKEAEKYDQYIGVSVRLCHTKKQDYM